MNRGKTMNKSFQWTDTVFWIDQVNIVTMNIPADPGLSPKHAIYAFSFIVFVLYLSCEMNKNKQKEAGFGAFFLKKTMNILESDMQCR